MKIFLLWEGVKTNLSSGRSENSVLLRLYAGEWLRKIAASWGFGCAVFEGRHCGHDMLATSVPASGFGRCA